MKFIKWLFKLIFKLGLIVGIVLAVVNKDLRNKLIDRLKSMGKK